MNTHMNLGRRRGWVLLALALAACSPTGASEVTTTTLLGEPVAFGHGTMRSYVSVENGRPTEIGVIVPEAALHGMPPADHASGVMVHGSVTFETVLDLPSNNPTPFQHILVNWNPGGHEPPGIYDVEHMDFHFYTVTKEWRHSIDPTDAAYQAKAERLPEADFVPAGYIMPEPLAFPRMGVHWVHPSSPELNGEPFTHTFIYGSWDGRIIFAEPMITKKLLDSKTNFSAPVPLAARYTVPGAYPTGYGVTWNEDGSEFRIALTGLVER